MIERLLAIRRNALLNGDYNLAAETEAHLARLGVTSYAVAEEVGVERAVPVKRGPGRPRKDAA